MNNTNNGTLKVFRTFRNILTSIAFLFLGLHIGHYYGEEMGNACIIWSIVTIAISTILSICIYEMEERK